MFCTASSCKTSSLLGYLKPLTGSLRVPQRAPVKLLSAGLPEASHWVSEGPTASSCKTSSLLGYLKPLTGSLRVPQRAPGSYSAPPESGSKQ
ncbi:M-agglutinin [Dissostichus eleginoides]|uniref:M-agglutinin n=1 Tax=Dissostichus eleginoides TaxID=100907 RepID=A0AAD9C390_DISEL|nr:M-agglutinin [Dissostichus eleginoides]